MAQPLRFGVVHDFRSPPGSETSLPDVYAQALEQIEMVDQLGLDLVWFTEHHFLEDGHLPNFVPVAGAVAARTSRVRISTDILLAPFAHPIRLAEDLAVLDNLSGGRMELGIGMGYAAHEFKGFGIPQSRRVSLTEELVEILQLAWRGERFSFHGKRYDFDDLTVTPVPIQEGGPPLWIAGMSANAAVRAARYDTHLLPQGAPEVVLEPWRAELRSTGRDPDDYRVGIIRSVFVTDDRERDWTPIKAAERYRNGVYARFFAETPDELSAFDPEQQSIPQGWIVGDEDHCVDELVSFINTYGLTDVVTWGAPPGMAPSLMNPSLERFARDVVPRVRAAIEG
ncbi:MAG: LLM class flavin-dependent oxidoreductase [Actinomycetota bacterium]|jgi:alkanesulfonate monooxygenase SsuD/methylene tetrahydromethanopterin reductase-like flavin-dependent oxidoreductase (luciferase family)|nr:LLM class flavin-dependent oxidoreductase [Actinomycetota bacterium]